MHLDVFLLPKSVRVCVELYYFFRASLVALLVKNLPERREAWVLSPGWEDPLGKGTATHSSVLAWRIPWTIYSPWGCKESDMTEAVWDNFFTRQDIQVICFFLNDLCRAVFSKESANSSKFPICGRYKTEHNIILFFF